MSTYLKSEIFRLSVEAGVPAAGEGGPAGDTGSCPDHGSTGVGLCAGSVFIVLWS